MGAQITSDTDSVTVTGTPLHGCTGLSGCGDHRVVMALALAAAAAGVTVGISGAQAVGKSWPGFFDVLRGCGCTVQCMPETDDEQLRHQTE